jgi:hypothetical protein
LVDYWFQSLFCCQSFGPRPYPCGYLSRTCRKFRGDMSICQGHVKSVPGYEKSPWLGLGTVGDALGRNPGRAARVGLRRRSLRRVRTRGPGFDLGRRAGRRRRRTGFAHDLASVEATEIMRAK